MVKPVNDIKLLFIRFGEVFLFGSELTPNPRILIATCSWDYFHSVTLSKCAPFTHFDVLYDLAVLDAAFS